MPGWRRICDGRPSYWYTVKYRPDINEALQEPKERESRAGRYNPVIPFPDFPIGPHSPSPGARHATMAEALEDAEADGTRSIIDLDRVADEPDFGAVTALGDAVRRALFGTTRPTREMLESNEDPLGNPAAAERISIVLYRDERPDEISFAGYSCDQGRMTADL